jgi:glycosyltransferase involved in cell wall biosynthesis
MKYKTVSIIVPTYNEENYIHRTIEAINKADTLGLVKEIIIINDGSTDKTKFKIQNLKFKIESNKSDTRLKFIDKKINEGKGAALKDGFLKSSGDIVIVQDADLEYNPEEYPYLLEPFIKHNADVVYGSRFISDRPHRVLYFWHSLGNNFLTFLSNIFTNLNLTDMETGYKVFRGNLIRSVALQLESKRFGFEPEITARISKIQGIKVFEVGISYWGRTYKEGKKIGWRDGFRAIWEIIKYNIIGI